jgi:hypothetical protein
MQGTSLSENPLPAGEAGESEEKLDFSARMRLILQHCNLPFIFPG